MPVPAVGYRVHGFDKIEKKRGKPLLYPTSLKTLGGGGGKDREGKGG